MDDLSKFIQSIWNDTFGVMAEITAIFYNALLEAGLSEDVAVTLTAKMLGEVIKAGGSEQKEDEK